MGEPGYVLAWGNTDYLAERQFIFESIRLGAALQGAGEQFRRSMWNYSYGYEDPVYYDYHWYIDVNQHGIDARDRLLARFMSDYPSVQSCGGLFFRNKFCYEVLVPQPEPNERGNRSDLHFTFGGHYLQACFYILPKPVSESQATRYNRVV